MGVDRESINTTKFPGAEQLNMDTDALQRSEEEKLVSENDGIRLLSDASVIHVAIYENERYAPFVGFSARNLLPTDRKSYTDEEGRVSFNSLADVAKEVTCPGWEWESDWRVCSVNNSTELLPHETGSTSLGWRYAMDFTGPAGYSNANSGSSVQKSVHFVRRRLLMRPMKYKENLLYSERIDHKRHFDLRQVGDLNVLFLDAMCHIVRHTTFEWSLDAFKIKHDFVLHLLDAPPSQSLSVPAMQQFVGKFVQNYRKDVPNTFHTQEAPPSLQSVAEHFPLEERAGLARCVIRNLDRANEHHCSEATCGPACPFAAQICPHTGCATLLSKKWLHEHEDVCVYKILPCALECGCELPRHAMGEHVKNVCIMRPVHCPFECIGCAVEGLVFRVLESHEQEAMSSHLTLAMERVKQLEADKKRANRQVEELSAQIHNMLRR